MKLGEVLKLNKISKIDIEDLKKYKISGVQNYGQGIVIRREVFGSELNMKKYQVISKNQLMWCKVDTKNGAFGLTHKEHIGSLASTNMALADIDTNKIDPEFLEILFRQKPFADYITNLSSGTTNRKYLTPKQLFDVVKLPDLILQEQKRFVEKLKRIEALKIESEIQTQKQLLTNLKQAILQEAIQGKLTQDWRTRHPELVEGQHSAEHLLQRIKTEKAQLIKEGKIKKEKPLPKITKEEIPFEIPKGWVWCKLGDLCSKTGSGSTPRGGQSAYVESGIKFLRSQNVYDDGLRLNGVAFIPQITHTKMKGTYVQAEDLLLNITGGSIGRCCIVPKDFDTGNINQHVAIIRTVDTQLGYYLHNIILSSYFQKEIINVQTGAGREGLPKNKMDTMLIPIPPLEEQKEIVKKVATLMQKCTALEAEITQSETNAQMLMQAVLKEAFEG
jgi:type I restriction enzyme S subunit